MRNSSARLAPPLAPGGRRRARPRPPSAARRTTAAAIPCGVGEGRARRRRRGRRRGRARPSRPRTKRVGPISRRTSWSATKAVTSSGSGVCVASAWRICGAAPGADTIAAHPERRVGAGDRGERAAQRRLVVGEQLAQIRGAPAPRPNRAECPSRVSVSPRSASSSPTSAESACVLTLTDGDEPQRPPRSSPRRPPRASRAPRRRAREGDSAVPALAPRTRATPLCATAAAAGARARAVA